MPVETAQNLSNFQVYERKRMTYVLTPRRARKKLPRSDSSLHGSVVTHLRTHVRAIILYLSTFERKMLTMQLPGSVYCNIFFSAVFTLPADSL